MSDDSPCGELSVHMLIFSGAVSPSVVARLQKMAFMRGAQDLHEMLSLDVILKSA